MLGVLDTQNYPLENLDERNQFYSDRDHCSQELGISPVVIVNLVDAAYAVKANRSIDPIDVVALALFEFTFDCLNARREARGDELLDSLYE